jgi:hypothetical protein
MNREINEIFKQWKQFLSWCYETNDKTTEIHRDNLEKVMAYTRQLENTIKEAIEYINEKADYPIGYYHCLKELRDILKGEGK